MTLSPEEAQDVAQRWLDANVPGATAGEADPFYGYYTLHFLEDGEIAGMLSVHGGSGDVWYHSWHGDFVAMAEAHDQRQPQTGNEIWQVEEPEWDRRPM